MTKSTLPLNLYPTLQQALSTELGVQERTRIQRLEVKDDPFGQHVTVHHLQATGHVLKPTFIPATTTFRVAGRTLSDRQARRIAQLMGAKHLTVEPQRSGEGLVFVLHP